MKQATIKRQFISLLLKYKIAQKYFAMIGLIKKYWFYMGLILIAGFYFKKEISAFLHARMHKTPEKYTVKVEEGGQSLFSLGGDGGAASGVKTELPEIEAASAKAFLRRFAKVVQGEREKFGIPASALLALAYVNSHCGERAITKEANNFFALTCGENWDGPEAQSGDVCFRSYETAWASFRDAATNLSATRWAQQLRKKEADPEAWMAAFAEHGYSDVVNAEAQMKKVFKAYRLFELDRP
jgi:hypothetical protein